MAGVPSNGSPELRPRASAHFVIHEEADDKQDAMMAAHQASAVST